LNMRKVWGTHRRNTFTISILGSKRIRSIIITR